MIRNGHFFSVETTNKSIIVDRPKSGDFGWFDQKIWGKFIVAWFLESRDGICQVCWLSPHVCPIQNHPGQKRPPFGGRACRNSRVKIASKWSRRSFHSGSGYSLKSGWSCQRSSKPKQPADLKSVERWGCSPGEIPLNPDFLWVCDPSMFDSWRRRLRPTKVLIFSLNPYSLCILKHP